MGFLIEAEAWLNVCIISDICKCHLQVYFCRIPFCREILEQKHAATTAAITNDEAEILEQLTAATFACKEETIDSKDQELLALIGRRKKTSARRSIKQGIRDNKKSKRHEKIHDILEEFSGIRSIASIRQEKTVLITHLGNKSGNIEAMRKGITNVFAEFYKDLCSRRRTMKQNRQTAQRSRT